ncbi:MAG: hypothetical protein JWL66_610 [Sphingomonadales bacterium]|nr:hypothetical protein [Sphingomonadales bacterium]
MPLTRISRSIAIAVALIVLSVSFLQAAAYWPGLMTWDAIRQYDQALSGDFDDWHPPAMGWLWREFSQIYAGPSPMLTLQLALYWGGFTLLIAKALRTGRWGLAIALTIAALMPISMALMGAVLKDCLMAGALLSVAGLLAWVRPGCDPWFRAIALILVVAAATLRFNAALACIPLAVMLLPGRVRSTPMRLASCSVIVGLILFCVMPAANRLIGARPSGVETSLIMFDLGGITEFSSVNVFPAVPVANPVAVNHHCYSPVRWDPYSWWVDEPCPIGFELVRATLKARHQNATLLWISAIVAHPIAYAEHRLRHFNINTRFLVHDQIERPVQVASVTNVWGYQVTPNPALATIDHAALAMAVTPLGWPITWLAIALGVVIAAPGLPSRRFTVPLALSALLYGSGYLVVSVASEIRYHLWTMLAAAIACVFTISDVFNDARLKKTRLAFSCLPLTIVVLLGTIWRVLAL